MFQDEGAALDTGESEGQQAVAAGEMLNVTLVWTDPAGGSLQNDLDLIVSTPDGREMHGNVASGQPGSTAATTSSRSSSPTSPPETQR